MNDLTIARMRTEGNHLFLDPAEDWPTTEPQFVAVAVNEHMASALAMCWNSVAEADEFEKRELP